MKRIFYKITLHREQIDMLINYFKKKIFIILLISPLFFGSINVCAGESHAFKNETDKLLMIQSVLKSHAMRFAVPPQTQICEKFMSDMQMSEHIYAVEPDVRAESETSKGMDIWHKCDGVDFEDSGVTDPRDFFPGLFILGAAPFRYYKIPLDNKYRKEDIIYHEVDRTIGGGIGYTGYTLVDLNKCKIKGAWDLSSMELFDKTPRSLYRLNMIVKYYDSPLILELFANTDNEKDSNYRFAVYGVKKNKHVFCEWHELN